MSTSAACGSAPLADTGGRLNGAMTGRARMFRTVSIAAMVRDALDAGATQHQLDMLRRGLARAFVHLVHHVDHCRRDRRRDAALATLGHHIPVHVVDLRWPSLGHVLRHRRSSAPLIFGTRYPSASP